MRYGVDMKFKGKSHDLELWPWPGVWVAESWVLQTVSLRGTFEWISIKLFQWVQEILRRHESQGSIPWPWPVTLHLCSGVNSSSHRLTERNIWVKFNENRSKGSADMEQTWNWRVNPMTLNCFVCLIWFFMSQSTIFQLCLDGSSWVESTLSKD